MEDTGKNEGAPGHQAQGRPATTDDVRARIVASVQSEIARLEEHAQMLREAGFRKTSEPFCHAMEAIAVIKARVEVYVIQVEMAASTAAMATIIGNAMRQRAAQPGAPTESAGHVDAELIRKASRPGGNSPSGAR